MTLKRLDARMTFGPNYAVQETKAWHSESLLGFFPAALLEAIAENIVTQDLDHVQGMMSSTLQY